MQVHRLVCLISTFSTTRYVQNLPIEKYGYDGRPGIAGITCIVIAAIFCLGRVSLNVECLSCLVASISDCSSISVKARLMNLLLWLGSAQ